MSITVLEPRAVWRHFAALCTHPRLSGHEGRVRQYVMDQARVAGARSAVDGYGNVVVTIPGEPGMPALALQSHLDMVPALSEGITHNWATDPIRPLEMGDVVRAQGTTLGADNGIGVAMALALLTDGKRRRIPLELLFTVEEEIGLHGASNLEPQSITARSLINLDSEGIDTLTIGCTGGATWRLNLPLNLETPPDGAAAILIEIVGGQGGHSGIEIHKPRMNALKVLGEAIEHLRDSGLSLRIASLTGGSAPNAIPGSAAATLVVAERDFGLAGELWAALADGLTARLRKDESGAALKFSQTVLPSRVAEEQTTSRLLALIAALPHGVQRMSHAYSGKVETSANLAMAGTISGGISLTVSVRSFLDDALESLQASIRETASRNGAAAERVSSYPGWTPRENSPLLGQTIRAFRQVYNRDPSIEVVHAGLECGAILERIPGLDAVSFGPDIHGAHTPDESVNISTVRTTWQMLNLLLDGLEQAEVQSLP